MNDKCASGTGATIDKCMLKVGAAAGEVVPTSRFDDSKLHHVAAKCGVFAETDIVNLVKSGIPSTEILCSLADAIVMQNLSVLTRGNTLKPQGAPARRAEHLPARSSRTAGACASPRPGRRAATTTRRTCRIEELIFVPENAQYYAALRRRACTASTRRPTVGRLPGHRRARRVHHARAARRELGEIGGPAARRRTEHELEAFRERLRDPEVRRRRSFEPGAGGPRRHRPRRRLDVVEGGARRREGRDPLQGSTSSRRATRSRTRRSSSRSSRRSSTEQGATLEVHRASAPPATRPTCSRSRVRADVNIVETVAHMMSAVHFFGDVDVICDIGGQDIKVLFMKNGDIANFRLSNQCSAGNGMLLQAMADQFGVPVTRVRRRRVRGASSRRSSATAAPCSSTPTASTSRRRASRRRSCSPGLAQVLPKNVWQYVVQIPRLAALGRKFVLQGGTQYNLAARQGAGRLHQGARARAPRSSSTRTPGEAGAIGAAFETLRVVKRNAARPPSSGSMRRSTSSTRSKNDEETRLSLLSERVQAHVHRHEDARRPDQPLHLRLLAARRAPSRSKEAMLDARRRRARRPCKQLPEPRRLRGEAARSALLRRRRRMPEDGRADRGRRGRRRASSASAA